MDWANTAPGRDEMRISEPNKVCVKFIGVTSLFQQQASPRRFASSLCFCAFPDLGCVSAGFSCRPVPWTFFAAVVAVVAVAVVAVVVDPDSAVAADSAGYPGFAAVEVAGFQGLF